MGHELAVDRLILFPEPALGALRGQITFDPELTRKKGELADAATGQRALALLRASLRIEADGKPLEIRFELRELWEPGGATPGDSATLHCEMPRTTREIRVGLDETFRALTVTVQALDVNTALSTHSVLLLGGATTPPYRLSAKPEGTWQEGGPDELALEQVPKRALHGSSESRAPDAAAPVAPAGFQRRSRLQDARLTLKLGFQHVLPHGWDHVLFIAGLVLGSCRHVRALLLQIGAFTVAHTGTLALGALGCVVIPARIVEPLIALSIVFVALQNVQRERVPPHRLLVVLGFGLLHGLGFAGALSEARLPRESLLVSLLSFNVGVELGQLVVVGIVFSMLAWFRDPRALRRYAVRPLSLTIAAMGAFWTVQRVLS